MGNLSDLIALFFSAFLAATLFPAQSEIVLVGLALAGKHNIFLLLLITTIGNVLGSLLNWFLGYYSIKFKDRKWFPLKPKKLEKYSKIYQKWGVWSLLFAWLPIVGDPLTLIAGVFRVNIWLFLLMVTIGKAARYLVIISFMN
jgi:membrane protein YqaA with SNARE-associated domain